MPNETSAARWIVSASTRVPTFESARPMVPPAFRAAALSVRRSSFTS